MTPRTTRRWLITLAVLLLLASIGLAWLPFSPWFEPKPSATSTASLRDSKQPPLTETLPAQRVLTAQDFEKFWQQPLRRPLYDPPPLPPPPPKVVEVPPPRPIVAKLLATMVEPGNSMAMLRLSTGETVFRKINEEIGAADAGAKVLTIEEGMISVERDQQTTKLAVDGKKGL